MLFFKKKKAPTPENFSDKLYAPREMVEHIEQLVCGLHWRSQHSINRVVGMALGGLRASALFSNRQLNDQAGALTSLTQKTVPLLIHLHGALAGNNQSLRLPFFRFFAVNAQQSVDFTLIARKLSEATLLPIMVFHSDEVSPCNLPSLELLSEFLGLESDKINSPTPAQAMLFGENRRRVPQLWNLDQPMTVGLTMPAALRDRQWASRQKFFDDHIESLLQEIIAEFAELTGRHYQAAHFTQRQADHWVVTTDPLPEDLPPLAPVVQIRFMTAELHETLKKAQLSFIDHNHSRALATALNLSGYSLVHYGPLTTDAVEAALELSEAQPVGIVGADYLYPEPLTPKEELFNQEVMAHYELNNKKSAGVERPNIVPPLALQQHPQSALPLADLHRFWAHNGKFFAVGQSEHCIATPALATGVLPAGSGKMQNTSARYFAHRIVEPADFVRTLLARMRQENYETEALERQARLFGQILQRHISADMPFAEIFERSGADLCAQRPAEATALQGILANASYFVPPSASCPPKWAAEKCIHITDDSPDHQQFFALLPNTPERFLAQPQNILLDRDAFQAFVRTDHSPSQVIMHLFSAVAKVSYRQKTQEFTQLVEQKLAALNQHIASQLSVNLAADLGPVLDQLTSSDLTLAELAQKMDKRQNPVDREWLQLVHQTRQGLERLLAVLQQTLQGQGRASHGIISQNASGVYPWSPVMVPWAQNGSGRGVELTLGIWEAHIASLLPEFILLRQADLLAQGRYNINYHNEFFADFSWKQLGSAELAFCPPLVLTGADVDFYARSQSLAEIFRIKAPIKVLVFDTLRTTPAAALQQFLAGDMFVLQSSLSHQEHLVAGMSKGFASPRPALLHVLSPGAKDYLRFAEKAVEAGIYPLLQAYGQGQKVELLNSQALQVASDSSLTLADLALENPDFVPEYRLLANIEGLPIAEYLQLDNEDRQETFPVVTRTDESGIVRTWRVSEHLIDLMAEQDRFKNLLAHFVENIDAEKQKAAISAEITAELTQAVTQSLLNLAQS